MSLYKINPDLTKLFERFLNMASYGKLNIEIDRTGFNCNGPYYAIATTPCDGTVRFWVANNNEDYAFACRGTYTYPDGRVQGWDEEQPGFWARRHMRKLVRVELDRTGFKL